MSERKKTWQEMTDRNSKWFTAADIYQMNEGREMTLRVSAFKQGKVEQSKRRVVALTLDTGEGSKPLDKPLGMNPTNNKTVTDIYGSDKPAEWVEQKILITVYIARDKDPQNPGKMCDCIRIRPRKPKDGAALGPGPKTFDLDDLIEQVGMATSLAEIESLRPKSVPKSVSEDDRARLKQAFADRSEGLAAEAAFTAEQAAS